MSLPDGDVSLNEVMGWVQQQGQYLTDAAPGTTLVLWYLCANAFWSADNPEGRDVGSVMSGRVPIHKISIGTGLSARTVRRALIDLQAMGYVLAQLRPGNGRSKIDVYWTEQADEMRAEFRAGLRDLPRGFQRRVEEPKAPPEKRQDATVLQFPKRDRTN